MNYNYQQRSDDERKSRKLEKKKNYPWRKQREEEVAPLLLNDQEVGRKYRNKELMGKNLLADVEQVRKFDEINGKIDAVLDTLSEAGLKLNSDTSASGPSTGRTMNMTKAYDKLKHVQETANVELEKIQKKKQILNEELMSIEGKIGRRNREDFMESDEYRNLRKCKDIVDCLFNRELNKLSRNREFINFEAGDGNQEILFARHIPSFDTRCDGRDVKAQRKELIEKIYALTHQLMQLEN